MASIKVIEQKIVWSDETKIESFQFISFLDNNTVKYAKRKFIYDENKLPMFESISDYEESNYSEFEKYRNGEVITKKTE